MIYSTKQYFKHLHDVECNQKYNKTLPYSFHLEMVEAQARKFQHHIPKTLPEVKAVWIGIHGHDSIEDARLTYNDIVNLHDIVEELRHERYPGEQICKLAADIIYACTNEKGKVRGDRHSAKFYEELMLNRNAVFVKLCDLMANIKFSLLQNSSMFEKYKKEWPVFKSYLTVSPDGSKKYTDEFPDMIEHIEKLLAI